MIMKRIISISVIFLSIFNIYAQNDSVFYKHEIRASFGDALISEEWLQNGKCKNNFAITYFFRPIKELWVGVNFINYFGDNIYYYTREYAADGSFKDFSESKKKHAFIIAPEIRFSCVNKKSVILYGSLSKGIGFENGFDFNEYKYPRKVDTFWHFTFLGLSRNFGVNNNIFLGGELGVGFKGLFNIHGGYRF